MAKIIDGKIVSAALKQKVADEVAEFKSSYGRAPALAVIMVGNNPASAVYVRNKHKACEAVGMLSYEYNLPEATTEGELLSLVKELNARKDVDGILVQLPLPKHINEEIVINNISPEKDVDAFHPVNTGKILIGNYDFLPCTPAGVMEMLAYYDINVTGKECVVLGRSNIVGKPMALLLLGANGTVTVCHSKTKDLKAVTKRADILVVAIGKAKFVTADMVKPDAVVIDVGINRLDDGKLVGDVDFDNVSKIADAITPVPGGVGPMTIAVLMKNTLTAAKRREGALS